MAFLFVSGVHHRQGFVAVRIRKQIFPPAKFAPFLGIHVEPLRRTYELRQQLLLILQ